jgi:hypothetical protein
VVPQFRYTVSSCFLRWILDGRGCPGWLVGWRFFGGFFVEVGLGVIGATVCLRLPVCLSICMSDGRPLSLSASSFLCLQSGWLWLLGDGASLGAGMVVGLERGEEDEEVSFVALSQQLFPKLSPIFAGGVEIAEWEVRANTVNCQEKF